MSSAFILRRRELRILAAIPAGAWVAAVTAPILAAIYVVHLWKGVPIAQLTRDPTVLGDLAWYAGFLSSAGVLCWWASGAVNLFAASLLLAGGRRDERTLLLFAAGIFTTWLALDDLLRFHETVFPRLLGIPEPAVHAAYAVAALAFVVRFRAFVLGPEGALFRLALACLAASMLLDQFPLPGIDPYLLEDSLKFVGIVSWSFSLLRAAWQPLAAARPRST